MGRLLIWALYFYLWSFMFQAIHLILCPCFCPAYVFPSDILIFLPHTLWVDFTKKKKSEWKISSILVLAGNQNKSYLGLLLHIHLTICPGVIGWGELRNLCHSQNCQSLCRQVFSVGKSIYSFVHLLSILLHESMYLHI